MLNQSGGTNAIGALYVGCTAATGSYAALSAGLLSGSSAMHVGYSSSGTLNQSGGTNSAFSLYLGYNAGAPGTYVLGGSALLSATNEFVGNSSAGTLTQTGGTNEASYLRHRHQHYGLLSTQRRHAPGQQLGPEQLRRTYGKRRRHSR